MPIRFIVAGLAFSTWACASVPVPATRLPGSPAHPEAAEAVTPAAASTLTNEAESNTYTCPMHPQIEAQKPGTCPICGMALVPKSKPKPEEPKQ